MHTQIRNTYLDFFQRNGHKLVPSSSLIPNNDPSLMFTNSGMVQFKNYFTGIEPAPYTSAVSSQKCLRAGGKHNDLENVGYTARHHTFFEMLGNFSFGGYFKEKAIELAWKLITEEFQISKEKLYITVYSEDEEAFKIWKKLTSFNDDKIIKISTADNFWRMAEIGPCGPCTEIFYDHGPSYQGGLPGSGDEGDRYVEIWNLVFMQFEEQENGEKINLPKPCVDTGMGLERITAVLQDTNNNFETDVFKNLINALKEFTGGSGPISSYRVIVDHIRAIAFLIADGIMPSNDGRGYVLRRIMRRAMRHMHLLRGGSDDIILYKLLPTLINEMGDAYPELKRAHAVMSSILALEEEKFKSTLEKGLRLLDEEVNTLGTNKMLKGEVAFKLYDTYGFPLDLTCDILREKSIDLDVKGFEAKMEEQKRKAKASWKGSKEEKIDEIWFKIQDRVGPTEFLGYTLDEAECKVVAIVKDKKLFKRVTTGEAIVILNQTPFYAQAGGQVGDSGFLDANVVITTNKYAHNLYGHVVQVTHPIELGATIKASIDIDKRQKIRANHSATHLLHKALRHQLGEHVTQKGSLVDWARLRFDFAHPQALSAQELKQIEITVNEWIIKNHSVDTQLTSQTEAIAQGAMALFGEKYTDEVRVVKMGASLELCGGTHVLATGDIGAFKIISEEGIAAGIRRIEAITGLAVIDYINQREALVTSLSLLLKVPPSQLHTKISTLLETNKLTLNKLKTLKIENAINNQITIFDTYSVKPIFAKHLENFEYKEVIQVADALIKKAPLVILINKLENGKVQIFIRVTKDSLFKAIELIRKIPQGKAWGDDQVAQVTLDNNVPLESLLDSIIN